MRCGIHLETIIDDRCTVCDALATIGDDDLPADIYPTRLTPNGIRWLHARQDAPASRWCELLEILPTITSGHEADLKVDDGSVRVWLSRLATSDGEPFDHTVYVEALRGGRWIDMGHFDGAEPNPHPVGTLGDGWNATYRRLGVEIER